MLRPSDEEFLRWTEKDSNVMRLRNALRIYPDLFDIKNEVGLIRYGTIFASET